MALPKEPHSISYPIRSPPSNNSLTSSCSNIHHNSLRFNKDILNCLITQPYAKAMPDPTYLHPPPHHTETVFVTNIPALEYITETRKNKPNSPDNTYKLSTSLRPIKIKNTRSQKHLKNLPPLLPKSPPSNSPSPVTKYIPRISQQVPSYLLQPNLQP